MPRGRPHASWLRQVEFYLKDTGMAAWRLPGRGQTETYLKDMGMAAWRLPGRWLDGGRRSTVARWTRRRAAPAYVPIPEIDL